MVLQAVQERHVEGSKWHGLHKDSGSEVTGKEQKSQEVEKHGVEERHREYSRDQGARGVAGAEGVDGDASRRLAIAGCRAWDPNRQL